MKVLFITRKFPPSVGGMELFAYDLSRALAEQSQVTLIKWGGTGRLRTVLVALPFLALGALFACLRDRPDVIHAQDGVLAPLAFCLARCFRRPFVVVVHGLDVTYTNPLFRAVALPALRRANAVLPISEAAAQAARNIGVRDIRIQIIPLAVQDKLYGTAKPAELVKRLEVGANAQLLLTVGRLVKRKGVAWFIAQVLPGLVEQFPNLVYTVIGEGEERPNIEAAIQAAAMSPHVRLLGQVSDSVLREAYNGADVFLMPNINVPGDMEGFGLVLLEASLCALPVVAANTEGIKDAVVDGKNAVLVSVGDAPAYKHQISQFLQDQAYAKRFGQASRRFTLQHYSWKAQAKRYETVYKRLLSA